MAAPRAMTRVAFGVAAPPPSLALLDGTRGRAGEPGAAWPPFTGMSSAAASLAGGCGGRSSRARDAGLRGAAAPSPVPPPPPPPPPRLCGDGGATAVRNDSRKCSTRRPSCLCPPPDASCCWRRLAAACVPAQSDIDECAVGDFGGDGADVVATRNADVVGGPGGGGASPPAADEDAGVLDGIASSCRCSCGLFGASHRDHGASMGHLGSQAGGGCLPPPFAAC